MNERQVVLGAGPIGRGIARLLAERGVSVDLVSRTGAGPALPGVHRVALDVTDGAATAQLAEGAAAIYNAMNPAYHRWPQDWPPLATSVLDAAEASGAVLVTVSNLYGYGPVDGVMTEDLPLAAPGSKGRVRAQMVQEALAAHDAGRVRAVEVRASDYIGPGAESHMGDRVVPRILAGRSVKVLGATDQPHTWTFTDDVAACAVAAAGDPGSHGRAWHVPSHEPRTQEQVVADFAAAAGRPTPTVTGYGRTSLWVAGRFSPVIRELAETTYQFDRPFVMASSAAQERFGLAPTPWDEIIGRTLDSFRPAAAA